MRALWFLFLLIMLAPLGALFVGDAPGGDISTVSVLMQSAVYNTIFLALGVGLLSLLMGTVAAWSVSYYPLWGRVLLHKVLFLPLVFPSYVLAFIFLGEWNDSILLQGELWALIVVMSLSLFPYVYIFSLSALNTVSQSDWEMNEVLGRGFFYFLKRAIFPKVAPLLLSALVLVLFETLADFGAASILNVPVMTTLIYKLWYDLFSFASAVQLSIHYLFVVVFLLMLEQLLKKGEGLAGFSGRSLKTLKLPSWVKALLSLFCWSLVGLAVLFPTFQILVWFSEAVTESQFLDTLWVFAKTLILALSCGLLVVVSSVLLSYFLRWGKLDGKTWESVATIGYSVPGSILAVAVFSLGLFLFTRLSPALSFVLLVFGLSYKFFPVGLRAVGGRLRQISPKMDEFSETTGASLFKTYYRLHGPLLVKAIVVSIVLVSIEVMKEMPMTLMLAPSQWNTLSIQIFNFTSEGEWEKAAIPGLFLIVGGLISIALLFSGEEKTRGNT